MYVNILELEYKAATFQRSFRCVRWETWRVTTHLAHASFSALRALLVRLGTCIAFAAAFRSCGHVLSFASAPSHSDIRAARGCPTCPRGRSATGTPTYSSRSTCMYATSRASSDLALLAQRASAAVCAPGHAHREGTLGVSSTIKARSVKCRCVFCAPRPRADACTCAAVRARRRAQRQQRTGPGQSASSPCSCQTALTQRASDVILLDHGTCCRARERWAAQVARRNTQEQQSEPELLEISSRSQQSASHGASSAPRARGCPIWAIRAS